MYSARFVARCLNKAHVSQSNTSQIHTLLSLFLSLSVACRFFSSDVRECDIAFVIERYRCSEHSRTPLPANCSITGTNVYFDGKVVRDTRATDAAGTDSHALRISRSGLIKRLLLLITENIDVPPHVTSQKYLSSVTFIISAIN